jgi:hypothetical protein
MRRDLRYRAHQSRATQSPRRTRSIRQACRPSAVPRSSKAVFPETDATSVARFEHAGGIPPIYRTSASEAMLPSAHTAIVALKATHGRIPATRHWPRVPRRFWHVGPMAPEPRHRAGSLDPGRTGRRRRLRDQPPQHRYRWRNATQASAPAGMAGRARFWTSNASCLARSAR